MKNPPPWISVKERYPDVGQDVVYFFDICGTYVGKYFGEHCFGGEAGFLTDDVTHWMPYYKPKRRLLTEESNDERARQGRGASLGPIADGPAALTSNPESVWLVFSNATGTPYPATPTSPGAVEYRRVVETKAEPDPDECRIEFEAFAATRGWDCSMDFFTSEANPFVDHDTRLAYTIWMASRSPVKSKEESGNA